MKRECLEFALESPWEPHGNWGGLPSHEVRQLWRARGGGQARLEALELLGLR